MNSAVDTNVRTEKLAACPLCGGADGAVWTIGRDRLRRVTDQSFAYTSCAGCGTIYQSDRVVEADVGRFYPSDYGPHVRGAVYRRWSRLPKGLDKAFARRAAKRMAVDAFQAELTAFYAALKPGDTLLDFGCGAGGFLDRWRAKGCVTIGMDFSPQALEQVAARGHIALPANQEGWAEVAPGCAGAVRMNHVIEHVYDVRDVLARVVGAMRPGGRLHLATPNPASIAAERYRDAWFSLDCPRHIILIPPDRMEALLTEAGLTQIRVLHEPLSKDLVRSWAYRQVDRGRMQASHVEGLVDDGFLNWWFAGQAAQAQQLGRSDRYHVFAVKP